MSRPELRDLRSLERRSMYSIFAPLDASERLPRELLQRGRRNTGRRELAVVLWYPIALFLVITFGGVGPYGLVALLAATVVLGALVAFVFLGDRK